MSAAQPDGQQPGSRPAHHRPGYRDCQPAVGLRALSPWLLASLLVVLVGLPSADSPDLPAGVPDSLLARQACQATTDLPACRPGLPTTDLPPASACACRRPGCAEACPPAGRPASPPLTCLACLPACLACGPPGRSPASQTTSLSQPTQLSPSATLDVRRLRRGTGALGGLPSRQPRHRFRGGTAKTSSWQGKVSSSVVLV